MLTANIRIKAERNAVYTVSGFSKKIGFIVISQ